MCSSVVPRVGANVCESAVLYERNQDGKEECGAWVFCGQEELLSAAEKLLVQFWGWLVPLCVTGKPTNPNSSLLCFHRQLSRLCSATQEHHLAGCPNTEDYTTCAVCSQRFRVV